MSAFEGDPASIDAPTRVGLIGYGFAGRTFHAPLIVSIPGLVLVGIASGQTDRIHTDFPGVAVHADPLELISARDVDLIVIATPNESHAALAGAALSAGKHVVVDKPFTVDLSEARNLVAAAEAAGRMISAFHNRRWDSDFLTVSAAIAEGAVGEVSHFESHFDRFRPQVRDRWRERAGPGGGLWFDLGPHLVDQALQIFGLPDRVTANFARQRANAETDDWAHVVLDCGDQRVVLHASTLVSGGSRRFLVHGDAGTLVKVEADRQERQFIEGVRPGDADWGEDPDPLLLYGATGALETRPSLSGDQRNYYSKLLRAIRGIGANPVPPIETVAVMAVVEAAATSAATGRSEQLLLAPAEWLAWERREVAV